MENRLQRVIIAGSREGFNIHDVTVAALLSGFPIGEVVSGTARGVDRLGEQWAMSKGINVIRFPANWNEEGKAAGHIRNRMMGDFADCLIALWDGESKGTKGMIEYMQSLNKPVYIYLKKKYNKENN